MRMIDGIAETGRGLGFALVSGIAIAKNQYPPEKEAYHLARVDTGTLIENLDPLETKVKLVEVLQRYHSQDGVDLSKRANWQVLPWKEKRVINPLHLFGAAVCFADLNPLRIPDYIVPPRDLVSRYFDELLLSRDPLYLHEQFDKALSMVGPYPTAAATLLMLATRLIARDQETSLYGNNFPGNKILNTLQFMIAGYGEQWVRDEETEATGNTYYFWTNIAMKMLLIANGRDQFINDLPGNVLFPFGQKIMDASRRYIARQANPTTHELPFKYGLQIGRELAEAYLSKRPLLDGVTYIFPKSSSNEII